MPEFDSFARKIRAEFRVNPLLPFGTPLQIGLIATVSDGKFTRQGTIESILGEPTPSVVTSAGEANWTLTSGKSVSVSLLAKGKVPHLFPDLVTAAAQAEISFSRKDSFAFSASSVTISTISEPATLYASILNAYSQGEWKKEYFIVTEIATPSSFFAALSKSGGGGVLLSAKSNVTIGPADIANLAAKFDVTAKTSEVATYDSGGQPLFFNALRVRSKIFSDTVVQPFSGDGPAAEDIFASVTPTLTMTDAEFRELAVESPGPGERS
jgi:hypothetical protein